MCSLTHWFQFGDELLSGPLLASVGEKAKRRRDHLVVVIVGHIQVVDEDNVRVLEQIQN